MTFVVAVIAFVLGALVAYLWRGAKIAELSARLSSEQASPEKMRLVASDVLRDIKKEGDSDLAHKKDLFLLSVEDMKSRIKGCEETIKKSDEARSEMFGNISESVRQIQAMGQTMISTTTSLTKALTSSTSAQGNLAEAILEGILQRNGMVKGEDYHTQVVLEGEAGTLRPDIIIHLPDNKELIVDSKAPLQEYTLAVQEKDPEREKEHYQKLAGQIREHITKLGRKEYQRLVDSDIRFVLMFVPDGPIQAALSIEPSLLQEAQSKNVLLTSPMTIIPLIQLISYSWRQYRLATDVRQLGLEVETLGNYLYTYMEYFQDIRQGLKKANEGWNKSVASWQARMSPQLEKIKKLGGKLKDLPEPEELPRELPESPLQKKPDLLQ